MPRLKSPPPQFSRDWWIDRKDLSTAWCASFCAPFFEEDPGLGRTGVYEHIGIFFFNTPDGRTVPAGMTTIENGQFVFQYHPDYVNNPDMPPLSQTLPKRLERYESTGKLLPFFDNLLSEGSFGKAQGRAVGHDEEAINGDTEPFEKRYHRMMMFSRDCPGACWGTYVQLDPHLQADPKLAEDSYQAMIEAALASRASIAGVQPKLLGTLEADGRLRPTNYWETSTHIVKLDAPRMEHLTEYEYMSLLATRELLPKDHTSEAQLTTLHLRNGQQRSVLAIKRFDRTPEGGKIHFEEFNQLLGKQNAERYDGAYHHIADYIRERMGNDGVKQFYARLMSQFLLGNTDSHFKNFAMFHDHVTDKWEMTPSYDLAPTANFAIDGEAQNGLALKVQPLLDSPARIKSDAPYNAGANRMGPVEYEHSQLTSKIMVSIGESFGLSLADIKEVLRDLRAHEQAAKDAIMADPSPRLNARPSANMHGHRGKTLRQDFCDRLDTRDRQLFGRLESLFAMLENKPAVQPSGPVAPLSATFTDRPRAAFGPAAPGS